MCLQRWLNVVLDLLIAGIVVVVLSLALVLKNDTTGAQIGIALNMVIVANTTLLRLVESWTSLEISIGAVARLKSLQNMTLREDLPTENLCPDISWPSSGNLVLNDVQVSYQ